MALTLWSLGQIRRFLAATPHISDDAALQRYKGFVRTQMYLALVIIGLMIPSVLLAMLVAAQHGLPGLVIVLVGSGAMIALGQYHKRWEIRTRTLEAATEELRREHLRVSETWVKKPLPDF